MLKIKLDLFVEYVPAQEITALDKRSIKKNLSNPNASIFPVIKLGRTEARSRKLTIKFSTWLTTQPANYLKTLKPWSKK